MIIAPLCWAPLWAVATYTEAQTHPFQNAALLAASSGLTSLVIAVVTLHYINLSPTHIWRAVLGIHTPLIAFSRTANVFTSMAGAQLPFAAVAVVASAFPLFTILAVRVAELFNRRGTRITLATATLALAGITGSSIAVLSQPGDGTTFMAIQQPVKTMLAFGLSLAGPATATLSVSAQVGSYRYLSKLPPAPANATTAVAVSSALMGFGSLLGAAVLAPLWFLDPMVIEPSQAATIILYSILHGIAFSAMLAAISKNPSTTVLNLAFLEAPVGVLIIYAAGFEHNVRWAYLAAGLLITTTVALTATWISTNEVHLKDEVRFSSPE